MKVYSKYNYTYLRRNEAKSPFDHQSWLCVLIVKLLHCVVISKFNPDKIVSDWKQHILSFYIFMNHRDT